MPEWLSQLPFVGSYLAPWWHEHLADPEAARALLGRTESLTLTQWTRHLGHELIHRLIILGFTLLTLLFIYRDGPGLTLQIRNVADRLLGVPARRLGHEAIAAVRATVNGLVLVGLAEGAVLGIAYLAAGLPHALLFAFATGIFATVPFGAPAVFIIACFILVAQSRITAAVLVLVFASLIVFVADHLYARCSSACRRDCRFSGFSSASSAGSRHSGSWGCFWDRPSWRSRWPSGETRPSRPRMAIRGLAISRRRNRRPRLDIRIRPITPAF